MKLGIKLGVVSIIGLANLNGAVMVNLTGTAIAPTPLDADDLTADAMNDAGGVIFTSDIAQVAGANFTSSEANLTSLVAPFGEEVTGFNVSLFDILDGPQSKTLSASITTSLGNVIELTVTEGLTVGANTNPTIGYGASGTFYSQVTTNGMTVDSTTGVVIGNSLYTNIEFTTSGGEYISAVSFGVDIINQDGHNFEGLNFTTSPVPEPSSLLLSAIGVMSLTLRRRRS